MSLQLVAEPSLQGEAGVAQLRLLQMDMAKALARGDFVRVRQLDDACARLLDKLILANRQNRDLLMGALTDLKAVYAHLIATCQKEATEACH